MPKFILYEIPISGNEYFPKGGEFHTIEAENIQEAHYKAETELNITIPPINSFKVESPNCIFWLNDDVDGYVLALAGVLRTKGDFYQFVQDKWGTSGSDDETEILEQKSLNICMAKNTHPANCTCKECKAHEDEAQKKGMGFPAKNGTLSKGKVGAPKKLNESLAITKFVKCITEKNFAEANKYLRSAMTAKVKNRIKQCADLKPF